MKKNKRRENEMKRKILEEQERLKRIREEKIKAMPPPIVTLQSLVGNSLDKFYRIESDDTQDEVHGDSTMDFVKNLIAEDENSPNKDAGIVEIYNPENDQINEYNKETEELSEINAIIDTPGFQNTERIGKNINRKDSVENISPLTQKDPEMDVTTVDLVINNKSKKFKAILPK